MNILSRIFKNGILCSLLFLPTIAFALEGENMEKILPKAFHGWTLSADSERYFPKNLFDYINGGAELYLSFGFKELYVARFYKEKAPPFEVDLFLMGSSEDAFGVFRHDLEDEDVGIGQGSEYGESWLRFWKGQYYVYIYTEGDGTSTKEALLSLGRRIAERIDTPGAKPDLVSKIPEHDIIPKSLRVFHNHTCLNYYYYLASENILHLSEKTNGIYVQYNAGDQKVSLILLEYPTPAQSDEAYNDFLSNYLPEAEKGGVIRTENGNWSGGVPHGRYLVIVLDAITHEAALRLIKDTVKCLRAT